LIVYEKKIECNFINTEKIRGGGVANYVRKGLEVSETTNMNPGCGSIGCLYRKLNAQREVSVLLDNAKAKAISLVDSGKYTGLKWTVEGGISGEHPTAASFEFPQTLNLNFLVQHVYDHTFKKSTLDIKITEEPSRIHAVKLNPPLGSTLKNNLHALLKWRFNMRAGTKASEFLFDCLVNRKD
ncbi:hypothetical protein BpHYR1_005310, partial [Brachionus plicatilis]